jgi:hypothetical protein
MLLRVIVIIFAGFSLFLDTSTAKDLVLPALADPVTLHAALAFTQIASLAFFVLAAGIHISDGGLEAKQLAGHFCAVIALVLWGVGSLLHFRVMDRRNLCALEGKVMLVIGIAGLCTVWEKDQTCLTHLLYDVALGGALAVLIARMPNVFQPLRILPTLWITVSFTCMELNNSSATIVGHPVSMHKVWMHLISILFLWLSLYFKKDAHYERSGACLIAAGYAYFGGQVGACRWAKTVPLQPGAFALLWNAWAMLWVLIYVAAFAPYAEDAKVTGGTISLMTDDSSTGGTERSARELADLP